MHPTQIENRSDLANRMIVGDRLIETKLIEELFLLVVEPAPSWLAPVANHITATESLTKKACNGLLQQNLPIGDSPSANSRHSSEMKEAAKLRPPLFHRGWRM
jgi:hypothetical protein